MTWRRPLIWLVLAVLSFILAWLFWQMLDRYSQMQLSLQHLPNPPSVTDALWVPFVHSLAKLMLLLVAMTSGISFALERSQGTIAYLLMNRTSYFSVVLAKLIAQLPGEFVRVHKSFIVNLNFLKVISSDELKIEGYSIPIGASYKSNLLEVFQKWSDQH